MRISVIEGDSGYNIWQDFEKAVILLDGIKMYEVTTADEMLGYVVVVARDDLGSLIFDKNGYITYNKLHGRVEINFEYGEEK